MMTERTSAAELVGEDEWHIAHAENRPFVVYKFAATLDGRIAAADGTSQWITCAASRAEVHVLRAGCRATIVGSGTQQADNPSLAVRQNDDPRLDPASLVPARQPLRVIVDSNARTPANAKVLDHAAPTLIAVAVDADATHLEGRVELLRIPRAQHGLDLNALLRGLHARGVPAVFLEGGPTLAGSFIAARLVDRIITYVAPALLGAGKPGLGDAGIRTIDDALRMDLLSVDRIGTDVRMIARPIRREQDQGVADRRVVGASV